MEPCEKIQLIKRMKATETLSRMIRKTRRVARENQMDITEEQIQHVAKKMFEEWTQALDEKLAESMKDEILGNGEKWLLQK